MSVRSATWSATALLACLLPALGLAAADGLVPNAGFEEGADGTARAWLAGVRPLTAQAVAGKGSAVIQPPFFRPPVRPPVLSTAINPKANSLQ